MSQNLLADPVISSLIAVLSCLIFLLLCVAICVFIRQKRRKNRSRNQICSCYMCRYQPPFTYTRNENIQNSAGRNCSRADAQNVCCGVEASHINCRIPQHCCHSMCSISPPFPYPASIPRTAIPHDIDNIDGQVQWPFRTTFPSQECPVMNPVYEELSRDETLSFSEVEEGSLRALYEASERSTTKTVGDKLVVSVCHSVDHTGDTLYLDNMGISLRIPDGAVKRGKQQLISLVLNWDLSDNPAMEKSQSLVSPVVYVGPHGLKLEKPCTLSFRHCSFDPRQILIMRSETELNDAKLWQKMLESDGGENEDTVILNAYECQLQIDSFTLYTCVQSPIGNNVGKKWLQVAAFACPLRRHIDHHQIRIYFLNKTPCALQWAIQNEAKFGGKMVCPEKVFLFDGNEKDMFAITKYISSDWELVDGENIEKASFLTIWHGHCPHVAICYRRSGNQSRIQDEELKESIVGKSNSAALEISLRLFMYQDEAQSEGEKLVIQVSEDNVSPFEENEVKCRRHHLDIIEIDIPGSPRAGVGKKIQERGSRVVPPLNVRHKYSSEDVAACSRKEPKVSSSKLRVVVNTPDYTRCELEDLDQIASALKYELPYQLRNRLVVLLDPLNPLGNDWRDFAAKLNLDNCINYLSLRESPTSCLLDLVENKMIGLSKLRQIFKAMDRRDCMSIIDEQLRTEKQKNPVENNCP